MTKFERLLVQGSQELPDCQCGTEMRFVRSMRSAQSLDAEVKIYECAACGHELRLTVWADAIDPAVAADGL